MPRTAVVTGAFSFSGRYITRHLLAAGWRVRTLTGRQPGVDPFAGQVPTAPLDFARPEALAQAMEGARVLINTYWVRFPHGHVDYGQAVQNSLVLFESARRAGVRRVVHTSITNPCLTSPLGYFSGKARVEQALLRTGLSHAVLRPAVLFGPEDILINNIAFLVRRLPVFGVPRAACRLQPIHVDDFARLCAEAAESDEDRIVDAVGPETYGLGELARLIAGILGRRIWTVRVPDWLMYGAALALGLVLRDRVLTWEEIQGLGAGLLVSAEPPQGTTSLAGWMRDHRDQLGARYASEMQRHYAAH
ncbi:MAG: NAD(P)H-binding protein [Armatimonadetes bacterium]|nr:NAD(P)H-binding protein [Armatimonadota bacterium]